LFVIFTSDEWESVTDVSQKSVTKGKKKCHVFVTLHFGYKQKDYLLWWAVMVCDKSVTAQSYIVYGMGQKRDKSVTK